MVGSQGTLPERTAVRQIEGLHTSSADDDRPAIDNTGDVEPILAWQPPDGRATSQVKTVQVLRLARRQEHAAP